MSAVQYKPTSGSDAREAPVRLLVVQEDLRPAVHTEDDDLVMTFPHLVVRELIALVSVSLALVVIALLFDAPLEELANPEKTPNPAKAPWYFLGLQELLHYYPPLISGVVLPGLIAVSLLVIPYFDVNLKREPFWDSRRPRKLVAVLGGTFGISLLFYVTGAHPVWSLIGPTLLVGLLIALPGLLGTRHSVLAWLATRSIPYWVFSWFVLSAFVLTIIGVFFRGPGWAFTLPWRDGIYY